MPALPLWLTDPLWDQFEALLPGHDEFDPAHPLGCHRRRIGDRVVFDKIVQVLVFGCGYRKAADRSCSATAIRERRDEWIKAGVFEKLELIVLQAYDRVVGLELSDLPVDGCHTKAPCGGEVAGPSPVDRRKGGMKRSTGTDANGIPLGAVSLPATDTAHPSSGRLPRGSNASDRCRPTPPCISMPPTARTREDRGLNAQVAVKGVKAPIQNTRRWPVERTNAWGNQFFKLARCTERRTEVVEAYLSMIHAIITLRRLIRQAWTLYRWDTRPRKRP